MIRPEDVLDETGLDGVKFELLHANTDRDVYLLSGNMPWGCDKAVLKTVGEHHVNEITFYGEGEFLKPYRPRVFKADASHLYVIMEFVERCGVWNKQSYELAIGMMADMHKVCWGAVNFPAWIPRLGVVSDDQVEMSMAAIDGSGMDFLNPYTGILKAGIEKVKNAFGAIFETPSTLIHGDFMYVNMGFAKNRLVLFDWSAVKVAPASYELCYPLMQLDEVFGNGALGVTCESLIDKYVTALSARGINLDTAILKRDLEISYLQRCLFSYIPGYIRKNKVSLLTKKVPIVCKMITAAKW